MAKKGEFKKNPTQKALYTREYNARPENKKKRAMNNAARRQAIKEGLVKKGDGKDIDHKKKLMNGGTNAKSNLRVRSVSANRADNGGTGGRKKGS